MMRACQYPSCLFQSTHPSGVRLYNITGYSSGNIFQSTHPSGVRPSNATRPQTISINFNPRTPVGCDGHDFRHRHPQVISIHAPQWGATVTTSNFNVYYKPFQSTHPSGVRLIPTIEFFAHEIISIHAPQWGATISALRDAQRLWISIHAPQWGATGGGDRVG